MSHVDEGALHAYLDGALDEYPCAEARRVREHLDHCGLCIGRLEVERSLRERATAVLSAADTAVVMPPLEELRRLARSADVRPPVRARRRYRAGWAASIFLALGTGWMLRSTLPLTDVRDGGAPGRVAADADGESADPSDAVTGRTLAGALAAPSAQGAEAGSSDLAAEAASDGVAGTVADGPPGRAPAEAATGAGAARMGAAPAAGPGAAGSAESSGRAGGMTPAEPTSRLAGGTPPNPLAEDREALPPRALFAAADPASPADASAPNGSVLPAEGDGLRPGLPGGETSEAPTASVEAMPGKSGASGADVAPVPAAADAAEPSAAGSGAATGEAAASAVAASAPPLLPAGTGAERAADDDSGQGAERTALELRTSVAQPLSGLGSVRIVPTGDSGESAPAEPGSDPGSLVVPGLEVVSIVWREEGVTPAGVRVLQRLDGERMLELIHLPEGIEPASVMQPEPGVTQLAVPRENGWLVLRAPVDEAALTELLRRLEAAP